MKDLYAHAAAIADQIAFPFAGESRDLQRLAIARIIAIWLREFPPPTLSNIVDDVEPRDGAMVRLLGDIHRAEARLEREQRRRSSN